jgi:hypothetical protein
MENWCHFSGMKRFQREADFLPPCKAKMNNAWSYASTPTYVYWRGDFYGILLKANGMEYPANSNSCVTVATGFPKQPALRVRCPGQAVTAGSCVLSSSGSSLSHLGCLQSEGCPSRATMEGLWGTSIRVAARLRDMPTELVNTARLAWQRRTGGRTKYQCWECQRMSRAQEVSVSVLCEAPRTQSNSGMKYTKPRSPEPPVPL